MTSCSLFQNFRHSLAAPFPKELWKEAAVCATGTSFRIDTK